MTKRIRRRIFAGVVVATLLIALNIAALTFGWTHPEISGPAIALDVGGLALMFWLAWRQSLLVETMAEGRTAEFDLDTGRIVVTSYLRESRIL